MNDLQPAPRSSNPYLLLIGGIMLAGLLFLAWLGSPPAVSAIGQPLPELDLQPLLNVEQPIVIEDLKGKIAVIHFWGTWCGPCQIEYPEFVALVEEFRQQPQVVIVSVSSSPGPEYDLPELRQRTANFTSKFDTPVPTYADPAAMTRSGVGLLQSGGTFSYPTTLLVDRDGLIVEAVVGAAPGSMQELAEKIRARL